MQKAHAPRKSVKTEYVSNKDQDTAEKEHVAHLEIWEERRFNPDHFAYQLREKLHTWLHSSNLQSKYGKPFELDLKTLNLITRPPATSLEQETTTKPTILSKKVQIQQPVLTFGQRASSLPDLREQAEGETSDGFSESSDPSSPNLEQLVEEVVDEAPPDGSPRTVIAQDTDPLSLYVRHAYQHKNYREAEFREQAN